MADNPYVNKVEYGGQTLVDLTGDTATAADVVQGKTFHLASGAQATGEADYAPQAQISGVFSATATYAVGDYVVYNSLLYRCTTAHSGAWNAAHFTQVTIGGEVQTLNTDMAALPSLYAPAGYGLGSTAHELTAQDDLNNLVYGGYYFAGGNVVPESKNNPLYKYGLGARGFFLEVQPGRSTSQCKQKLTIYPSNNDGDGTGIMVRYCRSGTFTPWEWINPLFIDSITIEYRTTEKWRSKSVYARSMSYIDLSTVGEHTTASIPNINRILRIEGTMSEAGGAGPLANYRYLQGVWKNSSGQIVFNITNAVQDAGATPAIYYTKTT